MTLVFNASPLIVFAKAGLLERILPLGDEVWIPQAVADEISQAKDPGDPASRWIAGQHSLIHPATPISSFLMAWNLGAGESAVISLTAAAAGAIAVLTIWLHDVVHKRWACASWATSGSFSWRNARA